jgi:hypothetical protein
MKFGTWNVRRLCRSRRIFRKWDVRAGTGSMWLRIGTDGGLECGNEPLVSIKFA